MTVVMIPTRWVVASPISVILARQWLRLTTILTFAGSSNSSALMESVLRLPGCAMDPRIVQAEKTNYIVVMDRLGKCGLNLKLTYTTKIHEKI